jgi:hypothetical protein
MTTPIRSRLEAIKRLCVAFERRPRPSWNYRTNFATGRLYTVGRTKLTVAFTLHVVPPGHSDGVLASSVTVWPGVRRRLGDDRLWSASPKIPGGWNAALRRMGWYEDCEDLLRSYGYHGKWRHSPFGRFGDFWKKHPDSKSLVAEVAVLERLSKENLWGRRRPGGRG